MIYLHLSQPSALYRERVGHIMWKACRWPARAVILLQQNYCALRKTAAQGPLFRMRFFEGTTRLCDQFD